jgi:amidase
MEMGRYADSIDLRLFLTSVLGEEPWKYDSKVIPMPWRSSEEEAVKAKIKTGLTVGYFNCDGNVSLKPYGRTYSCQPLLTRQVLPHPPVLRGVDMAVDAMEKNGHTILPWKPYKHDFAVDLINNIYAADGCTDVYKDINASGEPPIPNIKNLLNPDLPKADMNDLWDTHLKKWNYQMEYLTAWRDFETEHGSELDCIIAPISPTAAIRHNQFKYYGYASAINLLDFTSVVVPVTFADKEKDKNKEGYEPLNEMDADVQKEYDADAYHGAPVAVQVIGRKLSEERTLAIAEELGRVLGNAVTP